MQTCAKAKTQSTNPTPEIMTELNPQVVVEEDNPASDEDKSSISPLTELVSLLKSMKPKSDTGKFKEPEPFTGQDPKKLKTFIFPPVACTFVNNLSVLVDRPLCTEPRILLQCYCNCLPYPL